MPAAFSGLESTIIDVEIISYSVNNGEVTIINESSESDCTTDSELEETADETKINDIM